jgi:ubiquinone/menaquinone biosynthesis C-methylase UbiE
MKQVDQEELKVLVRKMYKLVAEQPQGKYHFETGRGLAEKLGYLTTDIDGVPPESVESFAGVGHFFDIAKIEEGESVLDLGSGSGMDSFIAGNKVGSTGRVLGIDITEEQLAKSRKFGSDFKMVTFQQMYMEDLDLEDESFDVVISNGVINLSSKKEKVFKEINRVLKPGGRLALSDIVSEAQLTEEIVCDANLWASCIGGATQQDKYKEMIESVNMRIMKIIDNPQYSFISSAAIGATKDFGVKSVSVLALKPLI